MTGREAARQQVSLPLLLLAARWAQAWADNGAQAGHGPTFPHITIDPGIGGHRPGTGPPPGHAPDRPGATHRLGLVLKWFRGSFAESSYLI